MLSEWLRRLDPDIVVYVGAESGFLAIDYAGDLRRKLTKINAGMVFELVGKCSWYQRYKSRMIEAGRDLNGKNFLNKTAIYQNVLQTLDAWIPLLQREVVAYWPHETDVRGLVLKIDGPGRGDYWLASEASPEHFGGQKNE